MEPAPRGNNCFPMMDGTTGLYCTAFYGLLSRHCHAEHLGCLPDFGISTGNSIPKYCVQALFFFFLSFIPCPPKKEPCKSQSRQREQAPGSTPRCKSSGCFFFPSFFFSLICREMQGSGFHLWDSSHGQWDGNTLTAETAWSRSPGGWWIWVLL